MASVCLADAWSLSDALFEDKTLHMTDGISHLRPTLVKSLNT